MIRSLSLILVVCACSPVKKEPATDWSRQYCDSTIQMIFPVEPDAKYAEYDGCKELTVDSNFEFDPDDPPEVLDYKLQFTGLEDPDMECWMVLTSQGVCGPGAYGIGDGQSTSLVFSTFDCPFVPDEYEQEFEAVSGTLMLENASAGTKTGDFTDERLFTEIQGELNASTEEGVEISVTWSIGAFIRGEDGEEADCALIE